jgi:hypothetical protein
VDAGVGGALRGVLGISCSRTVPIGLPQIGETVVDGGHAADGPGAVVKDFVNNVRREPQPRHAGRRGATEDVESPVRDLVALLLSQRLALGGIAANIAAAKLPSGNSL